MPIISGSSAALSSLPGFEIGYDQITAQVNVASTSETSPTTIIAGSSYTFDGAPVIATFYAPYIENGSASVANITIGLYEGATRLGRLVFLSIATATLQEFLTPMAQRRFTPSAGAHTYSIGAFVNTTTGTPNVGAGPGVAADYMPAFLRFTKV